MFSSRSLTVLALVLCGASIAPRVALADSTPATEPERLAKAAELYRQANKLYDEHKLASAELLYRQAWEMRQTYDVASNLGALELDLGKPVAAAEHLTFALRQFPVRGKPAERAALAARLEKAKKLVCTLRVEVSVPGAQVLVDGKSVGVAPLVDELFIEPGARKIEAKLSGREDAKHVITAAAGSEHEVFLSLVPARSAAPAPVATPAPAPPSASKQSSKPPSRVAGASKPAPIPAPPAARSPLPAIVLGAASVVAIGVGGTFIGLAEASRADAVAQHDRLKASGVSCATPSPACTELTDHTARADMLGNAGIGVLVGAGVLGAASAAYILWPGKKPAARTPDTALRASFGASPLGGSVTVTGTF